MPTSSNPSSGLRSALELRRLEPRDRSALEALLRGTEMFYEPEIAVALELVDLGLSPGGGGYEFCVADLGAGAAGRAGSGTGAAVARCTSLSTRR